MACNFCRRRDFLNYLQAIDPEHAVWTEEGAREFILVLCGVNSRNELDTDAGAAQQFHDLIRRPFLAWQATAATEKI